MTRDEMNKAIRDNAAAELLGEIEHQMSVDRDYPYDEVCAVLDTEDRAETNDNRKLENQCRKMLVAIGFYRPMSQEEIDNTFVSSGTRWHFKMNGIAFTTDNTADEWIDAAAA